MSGSLAGRRRAAAVGAGCLVAAALSTALPAQAQESGGLKTATGRSEPIYTEHVQEAIRVPTRHGTLFGFVARPVVPDGVLVPTILTYSPYNSIGCPSNAGCDVNDAFYVPRGYARAVFDVVGTRESSGCYDYGGIRERESGFDLVEFLGTQPWSNGKVGMIGGSYDGTTQIAAAVEAPPHLTTIIPQVAIDRWYDYAYGQGVRYFLNSENITDEGFDTPLAFDFGFGLLPPTDPTDPAAFAAALQDRFTPCDQISHTEHGYDPDPVYDAFWVERDYRALAHKVRASVLIEGGWLDHNVKHWDSTRFFQALPASHPKKLVMGQWNHSASRFDDARDIRHAWFDHWLLGLDTGVMDLPAVDTHPGGDAERVQEATWPPPGTSQVALSFSPLASAAAAGVGTLVLTSADATFTDANKGLTEEDMFAESGGDAYLAFLSEPLERAVRISGPPQLRLEATSDAASTHITPVLVDVDPEAGPLVITRGFLNSRNRDGLQTSTDITPGAPWSGSVDMWDTDYVIAAGHRIGLYVSSTNAIWSLPDTTAATTTVHLADDAGTSSLVLPVSSGHTALGAPTPGAAPAPPRPAPSTAPAPQPRPAPLPATGSAESGWWALAVVASALLFRRLRPRRTG
ncbi:MAG TPA: CocE/NonD family hydrolase [Mycobacteriales bacterium]|nr:CocE/NonD family hydrolase [Mycobacteriales bacterium]